MRKLEEGRTDNVEMLPQGGQAHAIDSLASVLGIALCIYVMVYVSGVLNNLGLYVSMGIHRAIALAFFLTIAFLLHPATKNSRRDTLPLYDIIIILMGVLPCGYYVFFQDAILEHRDSGFATTTEVILCFLLIIALLEAGRRVIDWILPAISLLFVLHPLFSNYMPSIFHTKALSIQRIVSVFYLSESGIFGQTVEVAATIVVIFTIFSQFLLASGASDFFLKLALASFGMVRGGPAKAAIVGSSLFGMISGSPSANVAAVGSVTIPLMKKTGYKPEFAAAVEAVSSTGGQIMPPVMGTVAFLIADITRTSYGEVCIAASAPAILYYLAIFLQVDFRAAQDGLLGIPRAELPSIKFKEGWQYLVPLLVLIALIVILRYEPAKAALLAIVALWIVSMFRKETRQGFSKIGGILSESTRSSLSAAIPCAVAGIIVASLNVTGAGIVFSTQIVNLAGGNLIVLLILAAIASFILGTGLDVISIYIILSVLVAPALIAMGVHILAAHLFIMYWGVMSFITPPVAIAAFVAAGIAEADSWKAGWLACRLGIVAYLVPFMFALNANIILIGSLMGTFLTLLSAVAGVVILAMGVEGFFIRKMAWFPTRILFLLGGILFLYPNWETTLVGFCVLLPGLLWHIWKVVLPSRLLTRGY